MTIRRAEERDIPRLSELLLEVARIHAAGRPDIFRAASRKYSDEELCAILSRDTTPVLVAEEDGRVQGYLFAELKITEGSALLCDRRTLYIDDLCVSAAARGLGVGTRLYEQARALALAEGCDSVTLNVWALNEGARAFYEKQGMTLLKTMMEERLLSEGNTVDTVEIKCDTPPVSTDGYDLVGWHVNGAYPLAEIEARAPHETPFITEETDGFYKCFYPYFKEIDERYEAVREKAGV